MKKKILSLLTAFAMVFGIIAAPFTSAHADDSTKIVVYKVLMGKEDYEKFGDPREHDGKQISDTDKATIFGSSAEYIDGVAFRIYEVSDTAKADFTQGSAIDEKYKGDLDANKYYKLIKDTVNNRDYFLTANGGKFEATLGNGKYRIIEDKDSSTYNAKNITGMKAVPFDLKLPAGKPDGSGNFTVDDPLYIYPKNTEKKVEFDKNFAKKHGLEAITDPETLKDVGAVIGNYQKTKATLTSYVGKEIPYQAKAYLPKESFFRQLHLTDTFDRGMEFKKGSMKVKAQELDGQPAADPKDNKYKDIANLTLTADTDYKITETDYGFTLKFEEAGLKKINDAAKGKDIYVDFSYDGKVTKDAVVDDNIDNNITITYNHEPPKPSPEVEPDGDKITVTKKWNGEHKPSKVKYQLLENDKPVADVTLTSADTSGTKDLGNGIKFEVTGEWSGKFTGLEKNKKYKVQEFADGTTPEYKTTDAKGVLIITNNDTPTSITPTPPTVVTGGKKFVKVDRQDNTKRLEGAQFKIYQGNGNNKKFLTLKTADTTAEDKKDYDKAQVAYIKAIEEKNAILAIADENKRTSEQKTKLTLLNGDESQTGSIAQLKKARDDAYAKVNLVWDWGTEADAYVFTSNKNGGFEVKGLAYNKQGETYFVKETKAPAGYELPSNADEIAKFVVKKGSYDGEASDLEYKLADDKNTVQGKGQKIENIKVSIPKTGGIGSLIFVVAGIAIMTFAFVAYRRSEAKEA